MRMGPGLDSGVITSLCTSTLVVRPVVVGKAYKCARAERVRIAVKGRGVAGVLVRGEACCRLRGSSTLLIELDALNRPKPGESRPYLRCARLGRQLACQHAPIELCRARRDAAQLKYARAQRRGVDVCHDAQSGAEDPSILRRTRALRQAAIAACNERRERGRTVDVSRGSKMPRQGAERHTARCQGRQFDAPSRTPRRWPHRRAASRAHAAAAGSRAPPRAAAQTDRGVPCSANNCTAAGIGAVA